MKVCILSGRTHSHRNTRKVVDSSSDGARSAGQQVVVPDVVRLDIQPCMGGMACNENDGGCIAHDAMDWLQPAIQKSSVLVFATPMYWWNVSGPLKTVIDRLFALPFNIRRGGRSLEGKMLQLLLTSGQPASSELQSELESMGRKMCAFTGMHWLGIQAAGNTGAIPLDEQHEVLERAFRAGASLMQSPAK